MKPIHFLALIIFLSSCDDNNRVTPVRDVGEQALEDDQDIVDFLNSHFYNYTDFENNPDDYTLEIILDTIAEANASKTPLMEQVQYQDVSIEDSEGEEINHRLYYLVVREGVGESPQVVDSTFVKYQGSLLNGNVFEERDFPVWFDLAAVIRGFREGLPKLKTGTYTIQNDGIPVFKNYGQGIFFIPSGMAYFSRTSAGIPAYSPLIFKIDLLTLNPTDHDNDGIPSYLEDPDNDGNPLNDDTDEDNIANFLDSDDDGDGTPTRDEYDTDNDGIPDDDDGDGTPNYLDPNVN